MREFISHHTETRIEHCTHNRYLQASLQITVK